MEPGPELSATRPAPGGPPAARSGALAPPGWSAALGAPPLETPPRSGDATGDAARDAPAPFVRVRAGAEWLWARSKPLHFAFAVYAATRTLVLVVGIVGGALQGWQLTAELSNWDGVWYVPLARNGYPPHASHLQTTLGFLPGYPFVMWLVKHTFACSFVIAGLVVAVVTGFVATVLVQRLSTRWWGAEAGRKSVVAFCLFPGSVVFSMVYSEGLLLALVAACLLFLDDRR